MLSLWNSLPVTVLSANTLETFLKGYISIELTST